MIEEFTHLSLHASTHLTPLNALETITTLMMNTLCYLGETHTIGVHLQQTMHTCNTYYGRLNSLSAINQPQGDKVS